MIPIDHYSLIRALMGRQLDPLPVEPDQTLHQGQDSLHTRYASLRVSESHWLLFHDLCSHWGQGDPLPVGPGQTLHQGLDSLHT